MLFSQPVLPWLEPTSFTIPEYLMPWPLPPWRIPRLHELRMYESFLPSIFYSPAFSCTFFFRTYSIFTVSGLLRACMSPRGQRPYLLSVYVFVTPSNTGLQVNNVDWLCNAHSLPTSSLSNAPSKGWKVHFPRLHCTYRRPCDSLMCHES